MLDVLLYSSSTESSKYILKLNIITSIIKAKIAGDIRNVCVAVYVDVAHVDHELMPKWEKVK